MRSLLFFLLLALCWPVFTQNVATAVDSIQEQVSAAPAEMKPNNFFHNFDNALIMKILSVAYVIIVGLILIRIINTIIKKSLKNKMNERSKNLIVRIIQYSGLGIIVINVLKILNIDLTPLLGAAGVAGIALGFAAQTSVSNLISGLFLLSEKLFATGDLVTINDITGIVYSIDTLSIKIRTFDNKLIRIANTNVISSTVTNITRFPVRRINLIFTVPHQTDIQMVKSLLLSIAASQPTVLENPPPFFMLNGITRDGLELFLGVWMDINDWEQTYMGMYYGILEQFPKAGITFSNFEVHIDGITTSKMPGKAAQRKKK
ncbi:MAG TPA: mechanosensitive ion channel family protein [Spirochaetia bacterium]|nr:mechanosensitive ion channel family protein [Spirochaetia bacterium]